MNSKSNFVKRLSSNKVNAVKEILHAMIPITPKYGDFCVYIKPIDLLKSIYTKCVIEKIVICDICLIGGAASYIVAIDEFQPLGFNDIDINIYTTSDKSQFGTIRKIVYASFYEEYIKQYNDHIKTINYNNYLNGYQTLPLDHHVATGNLQQSNINHETKIDDTLPNSSIDVATDDSENQHEICGSNSRQQSISIKNDNNNNNQVKMDENSINKNIIYKQNYSLLPINNMELDKNSIHVCKLCEYYLSKLLMVNNNDNLWSLYGFGNSFGKVMDIKFVCKLKRRYEYSIDSFQVGIFSLVDPSFNYSFLDNNLSMKNIPSTDIVCKVSEEFACVDSNHEDVVYNSDILYSHHTIPNGYKSNLLTSDKEYTNNLASNFSNLSLNHSPSSSTQLIKMNDHDVKDPIEINSDKINDTIFLPLYCTYHDYDSAYSHLKNRIIMTNDIDNIYGGGLLKYCCLLAKNFKPDISLSFDTEIKMCIKFFKDLPLNLPFYDKINFYMFFHLLNYDYEMQLSFLIHMCSIVNKSCWYIDHQIWYCARDIINKMIVNTISIMSSSRVSNSNNIINPMVDNISYNENYYNPSTTNSNATPNVNVYYPSSWPPSSFINDLSKNKNPYIHPFINVNSSIMVPYNNSIPIIPHPIVRLNGVKSRHPYYNHRYHKKYTN